MLKGYRRFSRAMPNMPETRAIYSVADKVILRNSAASADAKIIILIPARDEQPPGKRG